MLTHVIKHQLIANSVTAFFSTYHTKWETDSIIVSSAYENIAEMKWSTYGENASVA